MSDPDVRDTGAPDQPTEAHTVLHERLVRTGLHPRTAHTVARHVLNPAASVAAFHERAKAWIASKLTPPEPPKEKGQ